MFLIAAIVTVALSYVYKIFIYFFTFYYLKLIFVLLAKLKKTLTKFISVLKWESLLKMSNC